MQGRRPRSHFANDGSVKIRYGSHKEAKEACQRREAEGMGRFSAYKCEKHSCGWHIGRHKVPRPPSWARAVEMGIEIGERARANLCAENLKSEAARAKVIAKRGRLVTQGRRQPIPIVWGGRKKRSRLSA